ncbi:uncharacterized protein LOC129952812 [Eupeodes corollae]|uniref:uncharacterized protein LOC129952812 n=1 Tax=Eupeodes corollae TaxID=290404 RepID=UPI002492666E|nr:uncharacterized protein LOC129952812 [Eupeodes corollae]
MKFTLLIVIIAALFAVVLGIRPTPPRRCDYKCPKPDVNVCATNGICNNEFPSQCQLEKYNCLFPQKTFKQIDDYKCAEKSLPQCTLGDL